jgi:hypothetical protein
MEESMSLQFPTFGQRIASLYVRGAAMGALIALVWHVASNWMGENPPFAAMYAFLAANLPLFAAPNEPSQFSPQIFVYVLQRYMVWPLACLATVLPVIVFGGALLSRSCEIGTIRTIQELIFNGRVVPTPEAGKTAFATVALGAVTMLIVFAA